ncbi:MAG: response regulator [Caldilineaceae bacterium]
MILVVDDEPLVRKMLTIMLQRAGYRIETAVNGQEALDKIESLHPNLITLDQMMPDLTGEEVRERMAQDSKMRDIPIIFVSAVVDEVRERQVNITDADPIRFMGKPFDRDLLLGYVEELLNWKPRPN